MKRILIIMSMILSMFSLAAQKQNIPLVLERSVTIPKISNFLSFTVSDSCLYLYESGRKKRQKSYCFDFKGNLVKSFNISADSLYNPLFRMNYWYSDQQVSLYDFDKGQFDFYDSNGRFVMSKKNLKESELFLDFAEFGNDKYYLTWELPTVKPEFKWHLYKEDQDTFALIKSNKLPDEEIRDVPYIERGLYMDSHKNDLLAFSEKTKEGYDIRIYQKNEIKEIIIPKVEKKILQDFKIGSRFILMTFSKKNGKNFEYRIYDFDGNFKGFVKIKKRYPIEIMDVLIIVLEQDKKKVSFYNLLFAKEF